MGTRGPLPKPVALRRLEGNPGKRPLPSGGISDLLTPGYGNKATPRSRVNSLGPPPERFDGEAQEEWKRVAKELAHVLTALDRAVMVSYVSAWSAIRKLDAVLDEQGFTYTTPRGKTLARPEVQMRNAAERRLYACMREIGLTPASRARLGLPVGPPPPPGPENEFFS